MDPVAEYIASIIAVHSERRVPSEPGLELFRLLWEWYCSCSVHLGGSDRVEAGGRLEAAADYLRATRPAEDA
jgi:hypothetical protein